jgi:hypothetical protein
VTRRRQTVLGAPSSQIPVPLTAQSSSLPQIGHRLSRTGLNPPMSTKLARMLSLSDHPDSERLCPDSERLCKLLGPRSGMSRLRVSKGSQRYAFYRASITILWLGEKDYVHLPQYTRSVLFAGLRARSVRTKRRGVLDNVKAVNVIDWPERATRIKCLRGFACTMRLRSLI